MLTLARILVKMEVSTYKFLGAADNDVTLFIDGVQEVAVCVCVCFSD